MINSLLRKVRRNNTIFMVIVLQFCCSSVFAQSGSKVEGKVLEENGTPLPGVNVIVKGTSVGTTTDSEGAFALDVPGQDAVLVFSFIGYESQEVQVGSQTVFEIKLAADVETLSEVVVVGYGETKKESLTSAITSVKGSELVKSPQLNLSNSFAGRIAGVVVNTPSGEPGFDNSRLLIRGQSTTGNNKPLVVIDGVANRVGGLERLDPNDIESISVLKDASAAIYGAQAANGVVLITTKRGTKGKPVISFSANQAFVKPTRLPEMANAATYAQILNEIQYYNNPGNGLNQIYSEETIQKYADGSDPVNFPNTDWIDAVIRPLSLQSQQNLSVNGGGNDVNYFVSLGRRHQEGIYKNTNLDFEQWNLRINLDVKLSENFKIGVDLAGRDEKKVFPTEGAGTIFRATYRTYPMLPVYYPGDLPSPGLEGGNNPVLTATDATGFDEQPVTVLNSLINFEHKLPFIEGLSVRGFFAQDYLFGSRKLFRKPWTAYSPNTSTDPVSYVPSKYGPATPELTQRDTTSNLRTVNLSLNYEKTLGQGLVKAFIAYEQNEMEQKFFQAYRRGFLSPLIPEIDLGGSDPTESSNTGNSRDFKRRNYLGRLSYEYNQKYMAEFQFRYDGSSIFPVGKQYDFYPSASVGWRMSEESWFEIGAIDNLKLRASYGLLGNDRVEAFQYINSFSLRSGAYVLNGNPVSTLAVFKLANPNITWETAKKLDIGIELGFLQRFRIELDYFNEKRTELLIPRTGSVPFVTGIVNEYSSDGAVELPIIPLENIGEAKNSGFEAQLGYHQTVGDLEIDLSGNFLYNKSEVVFLDDAPGTPEHQKREGKPIGSQLLYRAVGIFKSAEDLANYPKLPGNQLGDLIFEDYDKDGQITANDRVREELTNIPQIIYGFTAAFIYKNFDLTVLLQGQSRVRQYVLPESGSVGNYFNSWAENRWSPSNTDGSYPRVDTRTSSSINGGLNRNDFWLHNTSFLRIRNVELGYNLPSGISESIRLTGARIYVSAFNLATFSKVKDFDPEGTNESAQFYPQQQIFNIGVNLKF